MAGFVADGFVATGLVAAGLGAWNWDQISLPI